jgi:hypothetical protein
MGRAVLRVARTRTVRIVVREGIVVCGVVSSTMVNWCCVYLVARRDNLQRCGLVGGAVKTVVRSGKKAHVDPGETHW